MGRELMLPKIIQGGMGAGISDWRLARSVSQKGQLGVVAGTALDTMLVRRLQIGDTGGHMRRALEQFPLSGVSQKIIDKYYIPGGKDNNSPFLSLPLFTLTPPRDLIEITLAANFVEVYLAKEGHYGEVGINYLEKIQLPNPASIYGAMLAGVDYVLMGAGIPREIPNIIDRLSHHKDVCLRTSCNELNDVASISFSPRKFIFSSLIKLKRPLFIGIVASDVLAIILAKRTQPPVDGFVIENHHAGGHIAPPRGQKCKDEQGLLVYTEKDEVNLDKIRKIGLPFWLAGSHGTPEGLEKAISHGAIGVQVGTPFMLCNESGLLDNIKKEIVQRIIRGDLFIETDPNASPTGFPFKVLHISQSLTDLNVYEKRARFCDLGYLRSIYIKKDGTVGYKCDSGPIKEINLLCSSKNDGKKCLCNALLANIGLGQSRKDGSTEPPLITAGDSILQLKPMLLKLNGEMYSAADVVDFILNGI